MNMDIVTVCGFDMQGHIKSTETEIFVSTITKEPYFWMSKFTLGQNRL